MEQKCQVRSPCSKYLLFTISVLSWTASLPHPAMAFLPLSHPRAITSYRNNRIVEWVQRRVKVLSEDVAPNEQTIEGLDLSPDQIDKARTVHRLIQQLRTDLPMLLTSPLSEDDAKQIYTENVRLQIESREIASSREELVDINQAMVLAAFTTSQAVNLWQQPDNGTASLSPSSPIVECQLGLNVDLTTIHVRWSVPNTSVSGYTILQLDEQKLISHLNLMSVKWDGIEQDASSIGRFLSSSRNTMKTIQENPLLQPLFSLSSPILRQARNELLQLQKSSTKVALDYTPPVYVVNDTTNRGGNIALSGESQWIPVNDYPTLYNVSYPMPGSDQWPQYVSSFDIVRSFCADVLPALKSSKENLSDYFIPGAVLTTVDGTVLLEGSERIGNFYNTLVRLRQLSTTGTWSCERIRVLRMLPYPQLQIVYASSMPLPSGAVFVNGVDVYTLDNSLDTPTITEVHQASLTVRDGANSPIESGWFIRSVATAIETGRFQTPNDYTSFLLNMLQPKALPSRTSTPKAFIASGRSDFATSTTSDKVALSVYRIMETLHRDIDKLISSATEESTGFDLVDPPASAFLSADVVLTGYLDESLLRGRQAYIRNVGLFWTVLRVGLQSGRIISERRPRIRVELTASGDVSWSTKLYLKLRSPSIGVLAAPSKKESSAVSVPFQLSVYSDFVICRTKGTIIRHKLRESRINDQLTPGDVVSRWIKQISGASPVSMGRGTNEEDITVSESSIQAMFETFNWIMSLVTPTQG